MSVPVPRRAVDPAVELRVMAERWRRLPDEEKLRRIARRQGITVEAARLGRPCPPGPVRSR